MRKVTTDGREWAVRLGQRHRAREETAAHTARAEHEAADRTLAETRGRWPLLVRAISCLVAAYNSGVGRSVLVVSHDLDSSEQAVVTVESSNEGHPFLSATLEGALIDVSARDADGISYHREFSMVPNRNDERTAAYLLQNWMERL